MTSEGLALALEATKYLLIARDGVMQRIAPLGGGLDLEIAALKAEVTAMRAAADHLERQTQRMPPSQATQ